MCIHFSPHNNLEEIATWVWEPMKEMFSICTMFASGVHGSRLPVRKINVSGHKRTLESKCIRDLC